MIAIILAAGKGERLLPLTLDKPKVLIKLKDGETLLREQLETFRRSKKVDNVVIVTGYKSDKIEKYIEKTKYPKRWIKIVYNPFYTVSNNLMSLWMAKEYMTDEFIVTNGDNLYMQQAFNKVINKEIDNGIYITIDKKNKYDSDDMKVVLNKRNNAILVSKKIPPENASAESVGLARVMGKKYINLFKKALEKLARDQRYINKFWLEVFNYLASKNVPIKTVEIKRDQWKEMDFHPDKKVIDSLILSQFQNIN